MSFTRLRPTARSVALTAVLAVLLGTVGAWGAGGAHATSFRYWSYWTGSESGWSFSAQGAARRPVDGTVEGWRFAISEASSSTTPPRRVPSFARLCGDTPAEADRKRVGLVVDFGTADDAPDGESPPAPLAGCVVVPEDANGYDVLTSTVTLRTDDGLICGMNGYPADECGAPVADPAPSASEPDRGTAGGAGEASGADETAGQGGGAAASPTEPEVDGGDAGKERERAGKQDDDERAPPGPEPTDDSATPAAAPVLAGSTPSSGAGGPGAGVILGVGLIAALAAAALVVQRRRR